MFGHISYIRSFIKGFNSSRIDFKHLKNIVILMTVLILIFYIANNYLLWDVLPNKLLFSIYALILSLNGITSLLRFDKENKYIYFCGVIGSLLFIFSDTTIAHTKLKGGETAFKGFLIMLLYYVGQFLILSGNSKEKEITGRS